MLTLLNTATPARLLNALECADADATNGWLGDALTNVGRAHAIAVTLHGFADEVTMAIETYRDALRRDHWDTSTVTYNPEALHSLYLAAIGALAVTQG